MNRNCLFTNERDRTPLDNNKNEYLIHFKVLFPTWDSFKAKLSTSAWISPSEATNLLTEDMFKKLNSMVANQMLRYTTDVLNIEFISKKIVELDKIRQRENELYTLTFEALLKTTSQNTQTLFTFNREEYDSASFKRFADNEVLSKIEATEPRIRYTKEYKEFLSMKDPNITFIEKLANTITSPLQPNQKGDLY